MSTMTPSRPPMSVSDRLTNPLREVSQRQWTVLAARGVLQTLVISLGALLASALLLGYFPGIPLVLRVIVSLITWASVVWSAVHYLRPALQRWSLSRAARQVEELDPGVQERLSSAVELSQESDPQFRGSQELVDHLINQAEGDASKVNASVVVPFNTITRWAIYFAPVLLLWMFFSLNSHTAVPTLRGLFTILMPWNNHMPPLLSDIQVKPGDVTLAQGDPLDILAKVSATVGGKEQNSRQVTLVRKFSSGQSVSQALEQTGAREFHANFDSLQQTFQYKVTTDHGDSDWFTATVHPRPAVARLDVRYDYPKYTAMEPRSMTAGDGNLDALVGTKVTLTLHTTDALVTDQSQLILDEGKPTQAVVALAPTANKNEYQAKLDVTHTGEYVIKLRNEFSLGNKDDQPRAITAQFDEAPAIAITSPITQITVRPDDNVPLMYTASDDFGVARVEALIQVDDKPERTFPVTVHSKDLKNIKDQWVLSVGSILTQFQSPNGTRITYQLKATDNRDPDPQVGLSARQTIVVNKNEARSYADKLNEQRKLDLEAAIRKAIERLNQNEWKADQLSRQDDKHSITAEEKRLSTELRDQLATTSKDLSTAASEFLSTPFAQVAQAAKDIADKTIAGAADDAAKFQLDTDSSAARHDDAVKSKKEIIEAREALMKLIEKTEVAERKAEAAEALKDAAKKQEEVAREMQQHPENVDQNRQKQQEAIAKLQEAIAKDQAIQNQEARKEAQKLAELTNKIEQDEQKQTELQNNTSKQEEAQQAQQQANALAEEQKKLNEQVQQFAKADKDPLQQAGAQTPNQDQQKDLVKNIEQNQIAQAAQQAQQAADQLKQDAQKLADTAKNPNANPTDAQKQQQQKDQQNQDAAQNAQNDANKAADALKNDANQNQVPQANDNAAQQAQQAAQAIQKQADAVEQQNKQGANNPDVNKAAEAAKADAQQAAADAQKSAQAQNADQAKQELQQAAQELAKAGQEVAQAAQAEAKADQAMAQADNQKADAAAADQAQGLADQQQQIAQALAQQAQQAADAQGAMPLQQAAQQQQQLADQTKQAQDTAKQLAKEAQADQNQALAQRADQAEKALEQAAQAQQDAAKAEAANQPDQAGQAQADAQQALAKADQALRGNPEQAQANAEQGQGQPEQGHPEQGQGQPEQGQGQGHPEQSAAQSAQEAAAAQQQALQPNQPAAAEAAQALAQAAQASAQALPGQGQPEAGQPGQEPGQDPGNEPGQDPSAQAGHTPDSKQGIQGQNAGGDNNPPANVQALGISAADWAKLPPMMQKELMNAAQQSGPPSYKQMIKNYYIRVAHMQTQRPEPSQKQ
ncbi:MAG TPA: DUF4175 family protein [Tepidisphaeraceae bacterium]|jgi:hypothetical protein|nr:DUF4175 family protein [Tepidisphaeraceae bacterium]